MAKINKEEELCKFLNKNVELETKENLKYLGRLVDWTNQHIFLQLEKFNPLSFQIIAIEKFKIRSIKLRNI